MSADTEVVWPMSGTCSRVTLVAVQLPFDLLYLFAARPPSPSTIKIITIL